MTATQYAKELSAMMIEESAKHDEVTVANAVNRVRAEASRSGVAIAYRSEIIAKVGEKAYAQALKSGCISEYVNASGDPSVQVTC